MSTPRLKQKTPKNSRGYSRVKPSIKRDAISAQDYLKFKLPWACEDCSHFASETNQCTLGYNSAMHRREFLEKMYETSGTMTLCRFLEID